MEAYYKVSVTYPNGRTEEIEDTYKTSRDAIEFGLYILGQIPFNSPIHGGDEGVEPYFVVKKVDGDSRKIVFDSRFSK